MRTFLRDLLFLVPVGLLCALAGILLNTVRADRLPLIPVAPDVLLARSVVPSIPADEVHPQVIKVDVAAAAFEKRSAMFVDARERAFYDLGHIPGAVSLSRANFASDYAKFPAGKNAQVIVYCSDAECPDSLVVARALIRLGHTNILLFVGGWEEWQAAGFPGEP